MKKIGVSWGIAIIIQAWDVFQTFITNTGNNVSNTIVVDQVTLATYTADVANTILLIT